MEIINDFNLFVDSENLQSGKGDDFRVNLGSAGITAKDGQFIRLTLQSFNMYKNFYNVNPNNNQFTVAGVLTSGTVAFSGVYNITPKNYKTIGDLATAFSANVSTALVALTGGTAVVSAITPDPTLNMDDTTDRIISFNVVLQNACDSIVIQTFKGNDCYALLGTNELDTGSTSSSLTITKNSTTDYTFSGQYPGQRSTEEHCYLNSDCINNNIEMAGLSLGVMPNTVASILTSTILAKIPIDHEFINFNASTGREFIMNIPNNTINSLHFFLTDSKGRPLGRAQGTNSSTTLGTAQNTVGNLNCSFVIKVEIVQAYRPNRLITEPPPFNPLFSKKQGVLTNMNFGAGNY